SERDFERGLLCHSLAKTSKGGHKTKEVKNNGMQAVRNCTGCGCGRINLAMQPFQIGSQWLAPLLLEMPKPQFNRPQLLSDIIMQLSRNSSPLLFLRIYESALTLAQ